MTDSRGAPPFVRALSGVCHSKPLTFLRASGPPEGAVAAESRTKPPSPIYRDTPAKYDPQQKSTSGLSPCQAILACSLQEPRHAGMRSPERSVFRSVVPNARLQM